MKQICKKSNLALSIFLVFFGLQSMVQLFSSEMKTVGIPVSSISGSELFALGSLKNIHYTDMSEESRFLSDGSEKRDALNAPQPILGNKVPLTGDLGQMKYFFDALKETKSKKIRVAHYGDSMIEGDLITSDLRANFQQKFGGNGAGFLSMNSYDIQFRKSTRHSFSSDWKVASVFTRNAENLPLGINGAVFQPAGNSWVKFELSNYDKWLKPYSTARVFYKNAPASAQIKYAFGSSAPQTVKLQTGPKLREVALNGSGGASSLQINFISAQNSDFYGVSLENGNGIYFDNFPLRGNSGASIADIPVATLKEFNELMNYKLIILNFGVNVLTGEGDYNWYSYKMEKVISQLRQAFPKISILMVSIGDKSVKKGTKFATDPGVLQLLKIQKSIAEKNNVAFWNMFEAMGGNNSMDNWVNAAPALASKDYTHLTYEGATKIASLLTEAIMSEYNKSK